MDALQVYDSALADHANGASAECLLSVAGRRPRPINAARWTSTLPGDEALLARCHGSVLDIGCGAGRLTAALARRGQTALGVDIAPHAVALAARRGATVLHGSVFSPLPGEGRWDTAVLADGNIGIGGDPERLLRRCRELLRAGGRVVVEASTGGHRATRVQLRLGRPGQGMSAPQPWALVGARRLPALAESVGLRVLEAWTEQGRHFAVLAGGLGHVRKP